MPPTYHLLREPETAISGTSSPCFFGIPNSDDQVVSPLSVPQWRSPEQVMGGKSSRICRIGMEGRRFSETGFFLMKQIISFFWKNIYVYIYIYIYTYVFWFDPPTSMLWTSSTTYHWDQATMRQESGRPERPRPVEEPPIWKVENGLGCV